MFLNIDNYSILLDTGSPITVSNHSSINIFDHKFDTVDNFSGINLEGLNNHIDEDFNVLLGSDILNNYNYCIDLSDNKLELIKDVKKDKNLINIPLYFIMNIPVIDIEIDNKRVKAFLDTGAGISYIASEFIEDYESIGRERDFYPSYGNFFTELYKIPTKIKDEEFEIKFGALPKVLESTLLLMGVKVIIGHSFFNNRSNYFYPTKNQLAFSE